MTAMRVRVETITPTMAAQYLKKNHNNRPIRPSHVREMASQMKAGEWMETHQGIAFDKNGNLIDGQHRLMAIVESNTSVPMMVSTNANPKSFAYLDQGARRSPADILRDSQTSSEVTRKVASLLQSYKGKIVSPKLLQQVHEAISPTTGKLLGHCNANAKFFSSVGMKLAAVTHLLMGGDEDYILSTYRNLVTGNVEELPPIGAALVKQFVRGSLKAQNADDTLARGMLVFCKSKSSINRVNVADSATVVAEVRAFYRDLVGTV